MKTVTRHAKFIRKILTVGLLYLGTGFVIGSLFVFHAGVNSDFPTLRLIIIFFATILLTKYFVYMVLSPIHRVWSVLRDIRFRDEIRAQRPRVSVIIPAWNEGVGLVATIRSLLLNTYENMEIVVVNDGSTDDSDEKVRAFLESYRKEYRLPDEKTVVYFYKENGGKGRALNHGIERSTGSIIVSVDADCVVTPTAISNFVKCFADPEVMAAVGNVKIGNTKSIIGTIQYLEFIFSFYFKKADSIMNTIYIIGGAAGAFRREVFQEIGLYNPSNITEDIELSVRIQDAGMKIVYADDVIIYTEGASDLMSLLKQRLRWKRGRFQTFHSHRHLFFSGRKEHNKLLTCIVLPLALFGEVQLFCEVLFLAFLYVYSYLTHDFTSFISGIVVVSSMFVVQMFSDSEKRSRSASFFLLAPVGWLLFYLSTFVEYNALIKSLWGFYRKQEVQWQSWKRAGALESSE